MMVTNGQSFNAMWHQRVSFSLFSLFLSFSLSLSLSSHCFISLLLARLIFPSNLLSSTSSNGVKKRSKKRKPGVFSPTKWKPETFFLGWNTSPLHATACGDVSQSSERRSYPIKWVSTEEVVIDKRRPYIAFAAFAFINKHMRSYFKWRTCLSFLVGN